MTTAILSKVCTKCGEAKEPAEFSRDEQKRDGLASHCKSCRSASSKAYCLANSEIHAHNRNAKKRENGGTLSKGLPIKLFKLQRGMCPCCKQPLGDDFHMDHIQPIALGGSNTDDNIQLLRQRCNNQKSAAHPVDFMQSRGFLL